MGDLSLNEIVEIQREFDQRYWSAPADPKGRQHHILLHLMTLAGKLARAEERSEHGHSRDLQEMSRVVADLIIHAAQLCDLHGLVLPDAYRARLGELRARGTTGDPD